MEMTNRQLFLAHQAQTSAFPMMLEIAGSEGNYLVDPQGNRYLDLISGISVSHLGHGNQAVANAMIEQIRRHSHTMVYGEFVQAPQAQLSATICALLPPELNCVYLLNSGAEATELALKLAKRVTGRHLAVACRNAYHGSTHGAMSLNNSEYFTQAFRPLLPGISFITFNDEQSLDCITDQTACVITEVIQGEAGYISAEAGFLRALRQRCDQTGTLLIFDEIQSGMGKTGKMFAFEHYRIRPDVLLLGKALGAGMPLGAVVSSWQNMQALTHSPVLGHTTTFGGHPVIAAAAKAGIEELVRTRLIEDVNSKEQLFRQLLVHPAIGNISGKGLMLALELGSFDTNLAVIQGCMQQGIITDWFLFANTRLRIAPPLTITPDEIKHACEIIVQQLNRL